MKWHQQAPMFHYSDMPEGHHCHPGKTSRDHKPLSYVADIQISITLYQTFKGVIDLYIKVIPQCLTLQEPVLPV